MRTSGCVEAAAASVAFEVFGLLMRDEELQVFEVALAWTVSSVNARRCTYSSSTMAGSRHPERLGDPFFFCPLRVDCYRRAVRAGALREEETANVVGRRAQGSRAIGTFGRRRCKAWSRVALGVKES